MWDLTASHRGRGRGRGGRGQQDSVDRHVQVQQSTNSETQWDVRLGCGLP